MKIPRLKQRNLIILFVLAGILIAVLENSPWNHSKGSLLITLTFWIALIEGCIAVVAICDLVEARWIKTLRKELLAVYPLLLFLSFLFILLATQLDLYPWVEQQGLWLNKPLFMIRNIVVLLLTSLAAWRFALMSNREDENKVSSAVLYLLFFVLSQSLVAFDWVMSIEYPWYSTLFGAYFAIEAVCSGFAVAGILFLVHHKKNLKKGSKTLQSFLRDIATLIFGFSILWAGLFFTQFLVIWYGNLPEEVIFIAERIYDSPYREMSYLVVISLFAVPFLILLPRWTKINACAVSFVSCTILFGILIERVLYLKLVLPFNAGLFLLEFAGIFFLCVVLISSKDVLLKSPTLAGED